jgi:hypothetical protein
MAHSPTQTDYDHVNLILSAAEEYGLKWEVEHTAQNYLKENPHKSLVEAYQYGYEEWVK